MQAVVQSSTSPWNLVSAGCLLLDTRQTASASVSACKVSTLQQTCWRLPLERQLWDRGVAVFHSCHVELLKSLCGGASPHRRGLLRSRCTLMQRPHLLCGLFTLDAAIDQRSPSDQGNSKTVFSSGLLVVNEQNLPLVQAYPTCKLAS